MTYNFLDIETAPLPIENEDVKEYLMDKKLTKDSRKFNPLFSKVITICIKPLNQDTKIFSGDNEQEILTNFWNHVKENPNMTIVTHNGYKFDIPFLNVRSSINEFKAPIQINMNRWNMLNSNHFDVMLFFSQQETFPNINLSILGKIHNMEIKEEIQGNEIEIYYKEKNWDKINTKCQQDVGLLEKIFDKYCMNK